MKTKTLHEVDDLAKLLTAEILRGIRSHSVSYSVFRVEATTIGDGGAPLPPVIPAEWKEWDGRTYVMVTRFKLNSALIPMRADLIALAEKRGVPKDTVDKMRQSDLIIENSEIAQIINALPVPEEIRIPEEVTE